MMVSDGEKPGADGACERRCEGNASDEPTTPSCPLLSPAASQEPTQKQATEKPVGGTKKRKKVRSHALQVALTIGDWLGTPLEEITGY